MPEAYIHNSSHKNQVRDKWVKYIRMVVDGENRDKNDNAIGVITFPAEGIQDLLLFAEHGYLEFEDTQTGSYILTKGKVVCFEKRSDIWRALKMKLVNVMVEKDFEKFFTNNLKGIRRGKIEIFPVDCINLDYDANISKTEVPIEIMIDYLFGFQADHQKDFVLFITWPRPFNEDDDEPGFQEGLKRTIRNNLTDPNAAVFAELFNNKHGQIEGIGYEFISIVGLSKQIVDKSSSNGYQLINNEFILYGEEGHQPMMSVLYYFKFLPNAPPHHEIYSEDVPKTLIEIQTLE